VLKPGFRPSGQIVASLQEHVKKVTAPYKYPREVEFIDSLPKTHSGKIRRNELREREATKGRPD
jgi:acetyl-CoA synthetase/medium-chain acyl-CoA synthetase